ncbi:MAG: L-2-amino-thiazoline-4-carboxylic acid hydrolase [Flavobacteriales bacterium]|nr:L-2-amino-thiazoline-4-carboxylic acid hydrolase [Flavobacteriales bacterium]
MQTELVKFNIEDFLLEFEKNRTIERKTKPKSQSFGHWYNMKLAYSTSALYKSLKLLKIDDETIYEYVREVNWNMSKDLGLPLKRTLNYFSKPNKIIIHIDNILWGIVWTKPFKRENNKTDERTLSFDVVKCPYADYFKEKKQEQLCDEAICSLDYKFAKEWGVQFKRKNTIIKGCDKCDFKFINH